MADANRIATDLAAARLAEAGARALEAQARRAEMALLGDWYRDQAEGNRRLIVRLEAEQAAGVRRWLAENCGATPLPPAGDEP